MYEFAADRAKNRLYIRLVGFIDDKTLRGIVDGFIEKVDTLQPGIDFINDISEFKPASPEGAREIHRAIQYARARGIRHIMRVVGPNAISRMQFRRLANEVGTSGVTEEVTSRTEAERRLDTLNLEASRRA